MSIMRKVARFAAEEIAKSFLAAAGTKIGESVGGRIGAKIYTPPEPKKDEAKEGS